MRGHHLPVNPWGMAVARCGSVIRHHPTICVRTQLAGDREEARVAHRLLEVLDELHRPLAEVPPLLPRREPVDRGRLGEQRARDQVQELLRHEGHPARRELVPVGRVAREEQDLAPAGAGEAGGVEAPGQGHPQVGPLAEAAPPRVEELGPKACRVPVLVAADRHEVPGLCELEGDLADPAAVDDARALAGGDGAPCQPVPRLLEQHEHIFRAVVVAEVARLVGDRVAALGVDLNLPRHLPLVADLPRLRPGGPVTRRRVKDVQWLEAAVRGPQRKEVQYQLPTHLEQQNLAEVATVRVCPLDGP
mmetsp:Transcript_117480/g.332866  ORF Transcript_117480/g.332866 Transcript_117480/m.332866 type:complete len:305 (-) Transcript_117480:206-1120(-)